MSTNLEKLQQIIEAALLAAGRPLAIDQLLTLFLDEDQPSREEIRAALDGIKAACATRGVDLVEVSSGFRFQVKSEFALWVSRLWEEKPAKYSRATLETLALIAYRQPITRGEIEDIRGVSVSTNIVKSLLEREWIRVVGHRDVPGKPPLYGTTRQFLDYFNLKSLSDLPTLAEIRSIESIERELDFGMAAAGAPQEEGEASAVAEEAAAAANEDLEEAEAIEADVEREASVERDVDEALSETEVEAAIEDEAELEEAASAS